MELSKQNHGDKTRHENTNCDEKSAYKPVNDDFEQNTTFFTRVQKAFSKSQNAHEYILVALFIFIVFSIALFSNRVYPFGDNIMASYDMLAQIVPFIEHLFDVFDGKSSLFYSTAIGGGADVFGTLCYCLISPFTWLFLLFGKGGAYYGVSIVLPLKLIAIGFSALYFLNKIFPSLKKSTKIILALLYAYCGYVFVANTYINWLDLLIYLPFVAIGFKKIVSGGKITYFAISYALMIYTCFSLASFAMIIVFMIAALYVFLVSANKKSTFVKICLAFLISVAIALPVLVPSFACYLNSERSTYLFDNLNSKIDSTHLYRKFTYVVKDAIFLFLTLAYFIKNGVKRPIDRFLLAAGVLILIPVVIDESCNLLNFGSYLGYALRFGFLNSFYCFFVAAKYLSDLGEEKSVLHKATKKQNILYGALIVLSATLVVLYLIFSDQIIGLIDKIYKSFDGESTYSFYSLFAHALGGLEYVGPLAVLIAIFLSITLFCYRKKAVSVKIIALAICVLVTANLSFDSYALVRGNQTTTTRYDQYNKMTALIAEKNPTDEFFRIKDTTDALTADVGLTTHTNSFAVFSSVVDSKNFTATDFFRYSGNGINSAKSANGLFLGDMLMGYKYFYHYQSGDDDEYANRVDRPYLEKLDYTEQSNFTAYENLAVFPTAFKVKSGDLTFDGSNYAEKLNKLHAFLGGTGNLCDEYTLNINDEYDTAVEDLGDGVFKISAHIETKRSYWFMTTNFPESYDLYYCKTSEYDADSARQLLPGQDIYLDYYKARYASYVVTIKDESGTLTKEDVAKYCKYYGVQVSTVYDPTDDDKEVYDVVTENKVDLAITNGNTFTLNVDSVGDEYLFLSFVKLDGHSVTINGANAEFVENDLDFMIVKLNSGANNVVIKYTSPYVKLAVFGLIAALFVISVVFVIIKNAKIYNVLESVIYVLGVTLFVAVLGFFILLPVGAFISKAVYALLSLIF